MSFLSHFHRSALALVAGGILLSGCVSERVAIINPPHGYPYGNGGNPTRVVNKTAVPGQTIEVSALYSVMPDCSSGTSLGAIRITQQPAHGTAVVSQRENFPGFPPGHPNAACNNKKFPAVVLDYTPAPGFTGTDIMTTDIVGSYGNSINDVKIIVTVK